MNRPGLPTGFFQERVMIPQHLLSSFSSPLSWYWGSWKHISLLFFKTSIPFHFQEESALQTDSRNLILDLYSCRCLHQCYWHFLIGMLKFIVVPFTWVPFPRILQPVKNVKWARYAGKFFTTVCIWYRISSTTSPVAPYRVFTIITISFLDASVFSEIFTFSKLMKITLIGFLKWT